MLLLVQKIIKNYTSAPGCKETGQLIPVSSNQKYNAYLKELGSICNITSKLNTHLARHTFAHIMLNTFLLPMEDVAAMMGHKSLKTIRTYCTVSLPRIRANMEKVLSNFFEDGELLERMAG